MLGFKPLLLAACLGLFACPPCASADDAGLEQARRNFPPLIMGANVRPTDGMGPYARSCPAGGRVEQRGGPTFEYLGSDPANPDLCRMRIGGTPVAGWFGIWLTIWPGHEQAHTAMTRLIRGRTGDTEAFEVRMGPGLAYREVMRNEGVEDLRLLGRTYQALKISHYREGAEGNTYRSVTTGWKDVASGMLIYVTYQHISGAPETQVPLSPTAIVPGP